MLTEQDEKNMSLMIRDNQHEVYILSMLNLTLLLNPVQLSVKNLGLRRKSKRESTRMDKLFWFCIRLQYHSKTYSGTRQY